MAATWHRASLISAWSPPSLADPLKPSYYLINSYDILPRVRSSHSPSSTRFAAIPSHRLLVPRVLHVLYVSLAVYRTTRPPPTHLARPHPRSAAGDRNRAARKSHPGATPPLTMARRRAGAEKEPRRCRTRARQQTATEELRDIVLDGVHDEADLDWLRPLHSHSDFG